VESARRGRWIVDKRQKERKKAQRGRATTARVGLSLLAFFDILGGWSVCHFLIVRNIPSAEEKIKESKFTN